MAMRGKKQSPFIGKRVPLVDNGVPILYPRYTTVAELLDGGSSKRNADADADGEQQAKKQKVEEAPAAAANGHAEQPAETEQERRKREKREKREARRKKQQPDDGAAPQEQQQVAADGTGKQQDDEPAQEQQEQQEQQKQQQGEQPDEKTSGKANAEEAAKIRSVLGFQGTAAKPGQFGFGFSVSVEERVEAETKAKLDRLIAQDATPDGCVPRKVYVGGMPYAWDEDTITEYWSYCGEVEAVEMLVFPDSGRFRGIAFVTFKSEEGFAAALGYDGEDLEGHTLKVQKCKAAAALKAMEEISRGQRRLQGQGQQAGQGDSGQQQQQEGDGEGAGGLPIKGFKSKRGAAGAAKTEGYNVAYVGNVAFEATPDDLMKLFKPCGCSKVRLHTDKVTGKSKGFAHVHFETEEGLDRAMEFNGHQLLRRFLKVGYAQPKKTEGQQEQQAE